MKHKNPAFMYYPKDWRADRVFGCSISARGLWHEMMGLMHESPRYGYLCDQKGEPIPSGQVARMCGVEAAEYELLLAELLAAGVPRVSSGNILYSKRMVEDEKQRKEWRNKKQNQRDTAKDVPIDVPEMSHVSAFPSSSSSSSKKPKEKAIAAKGAARAIRWPDGFCLSDELRKHAIDHGVVDPESEWQKFENNHRGKGSRFVEWNRAWYTWVGNYHEFRRGVSNGKKGIDFSETDRALRKLANI